jgi:hypothetical protein
MKLGAVVKGRLVKPTRVLIYGIEGIGKSTFAAEAPDPIFIGAEDGTSELDVARFPEPQSWRDTLDAITELTETDHPYKTLAIDTLDWLEPMCWESVYKGRKDKAGKPYEGIEDFGYGKGYTAALDRWREMLAMLERLRLRRDMGIVLVAHSWVKSFKNPAGDDFDRYEMKLHAKAAGLLREWCDAVVFAAHETHTYETSNGSGRYKGVSNGARVLHTQRTAAWDAKNRYDLPEVLPLDWASFAEAVAAHRPASPETLRARIESLLESATDEVQTRVRGAVERVKDNAAELARIEDKLAAMVSIAADEQGEAT